MKRIKISFLLSLIFTSFLYSQEYYPFPESNSYWQYSYQDIPQFCHCFGYCHHDRYSISGDTLISGTIYHKLNRSQLNYQYFCIETFYNAGYQGAFRNQTEEKKVWFVPPGQDNEVLLYNFDFQVGDTLPVSYINNNGLDYIVDSFNIVEVGNSLRKKFYIKEAGNLYDFPYTIIEGIGGQNLIRPIEEWYNFEAGYAFKCFRNGDTTSYPSSCELIVSENRLKQENELNIFPNPSSGIFHIQMPINKKVVFSATIYNSFGNLVKQNEISRTTNHIDLSDQPNGLYFIQIVSNGNLFSQKIMKEW